MSIYAIPFLFQISADPLEIDVPTSQSPLSCVKRTYQPNVLIRKRRHGWRARQATRGGRNVLLRRRQKGRWRLTP